MKKAMAILICLCLIFNLAGCKKEQKPPLKRPTVNNGNTITGIVESDNNITAADGKEAVISEERAKSLWCYTQINDTQKKYYRYMLNMVENFTEGFVDFGSCGSSYASDIAISYRALMSDFPEYYWMPTSYYIYFKEYRVSVAFKKSENENHYIYSRFEVSDNAEEFEDSIMRILEKADYGSSQFEVEEIIHEELCLRVRYAEEDEKDASVYTSYGALVNGVAVCEGYSKAFQILLKRMGIACIPVTGYSKGVGHLWNMVNIDGNWYHIDITWNDGDAITYTYFNLTDKEILADHEIDADFTKALSQQITGGHSFNFSLPKATSTDMNYFKVYNLKIAYNDTDSMCAEIARRHRLGEKRAQFSFASSDETEKFKAEYETIVVELQKKLNEHFGKVKIKLTTLSFAQNTCTIHWENVK